MKYEHVWVAFLILLVLFATTAVLMGQVRSDGRGFNFDFVHVNSTGDSSVTIDTFGLDAYGRIGSGKNYCIIPVDYNHYFFFGKITEGDSSFLAHLDNDSAEVSLDFFTSMDADTWTHVGTILMTIVDSLYSLGRIVSYGDDGNDTLYHRSWYATCRVHVDDSLILADTLDTLAVYGRMEGRNIQ